MKRRYRIWSLHLCYARRGSAAARFRLYTLPIDPSIYTPEFPLLMFDVHLFIIHSDRDHLASPS